MAPKAKAQETSNPDGTSAKIVQSVRSDWTWRTDSASFHEKVAFKSLPAEYKAFAGKNFMERFEMREEWEQKDFLKRDRKRSALLKKNPNATFRDFEAKTALPDLKLADHPMSEGRFEDKIILDQMNGRLSPVQAKVAYELVMLGRPLATIDPNLPYAEQLRMCGFDLAADVAAGAKFTELSARDQSLYVAQDQDAEVLNDRNENARIALRARFSKEQDEEWQKNHGFWDYLFPEKTVLLSEKETKDLVQFETINGKTVVVRRPNEITYSIHDEVTRKVADKIDREEKEAAKRAQDMVKSR